MVPDMSYVTEDLNLQPTAYQADALPVELVTYGGKVGFEPGYIAEAISLPKCWNVQRPFYRVH